MEHKQSELTVITKAKDLCSYVMTVRVTGVDIARQKQQAVAHRRLLEEVIIFKFYTLLWVVILCLYFYIIISAWRVTWQPTFTATGKPAMCVGAVSILTARAVTSPPKPCAPIPSSLISSNIRFSSDL